MILVLLSYLLSLIFEVAYLPQGSAVYLINSKGRIQKLTIFLLHMLSNQQSKLCLRFITGSFDSINGSSALEELKCWK